MAEVVKRDDGSVLVRDGGAELVYRGYEVVTPAGETIAHESRGGSLASVQALTVGEAFVEISHLGHGPQGGELVMVVTEPDGSQLVAVGPLFARELPERVELSWPTAVDLAAGMVTGETVEGVTRDDLEDLHQALLGVLYA